MEETHVPQHPGLRSLAVMDVLARQADLHRARYNRPAATTTVATNRMADASKAADRLVAYSSECLAQGAHKLMNERGGTHFSPQVLREMANVGAMMDRHVMDGPDAVDHRRALLQRAEEYASFSPAYEGHDFTDDNEGIADSLNETAAQRALPRADLERELGNRRVRPAYSGGVDRDFTPEEARRFTDAVGELHQVLYDHAHQREPIMADQVRVAVDWQRAGSAGTVMKALDAQLAAHGSDPTLARFDRQHAERQERALRAAQADDFSSGDGEASASAARPQVVRLAGTKRKADTLEQDPAAPARPAQIPRLAETDRSASAASSAVDDMPTARPALNERPRSLGRGG